MIELINGYLLENSEVFAMVGFLAASIGLVLSFFSSSQRRKKERSKKAHAGATALDVNEFSKSSSSHVVEFIRIRKELKADIEAELNDAEEEEKSILRSKIAELERQIASPDEALLEAQKRIKDLVALLDSEGNDIGAERISAAKAAMDAGDFGLADDIFAEIEAREEIAVQRAARAAFGRGEVAEAEIRWHDAYTHYKRAKELHGAEEHLTSYARMTWRLAKGAEAVQAHEQLVSFTKATYGDSGAEYAEQLNNLGAVLKAQGQFSEAETLLHRALAITEATIGTGHSDYAACLNNLAGVLQAQGHLSEAERLFRQALAITEATIGTEHPTYAARLNNLGSVLYEQGQLSDAERLYRQALAIDETTIGNEHPDYAMHLNDLALVLQGQGQFSEAERLYRQALAIDASTIGTEHPSYAMHLNNFASVLQDQGQLSEAERLYRKALAIDAATIGTEHPDYAIDLNNLALVLQDQGQSEQARVLWEQALDILTAKLPADHPHIASVKASLASLGGD